MFSIRTENGNDLAVTVFVRVSIVIMAVTVGYTNVKMSLLATGLKEYKAITGNIMFDTAFFGGSGMALCQGFALY